MEWIKYQLATFDQWLTYSPKGETFAFTAPWALLSVIICLKESGVL